MPEDNICRLFFFENTKCTMYVGRYNISNNIKLVKYYPSIYVYAQFYTGWYFTGSTDTDQ